MAQTSQASGFIDIHSHVLYGLDDGPKTFEESLAMLQLAASSGTTDIVATPHANGRYTFDPGLIEERIAELSAQADVRIHRGCDLRLQTDNIRDAVAHPDKYTVNHKKYLLVEFPDRAVLTGTDTTVKELVAAGMIPVITHPERNRLLQQRLDDIGRWIELGCRIQVTAGSCTGTFGRAAKACVGQLMERGFVHFVASDAHNTRERSPNLREAYDILSREWGVERVDPLFVQNPRAVLTGDALDINPLPPPVKRRKWYRFWTRE